MPDDTPQAPLPSAFDACAWCYGERTTTNLVHVPRASSNLISDCRGRYQFNTLANLNPQLLARCFGIRNKLESTRLERVRKKRELSPIHPHATRNRYRYLCGCQKRRGGVFNKCGSARTQTSELVGNLDQLGIEIPELNAFGARSDAVSASTLLRTPEGNPIHEVRIQTNQGITEPQIKTILEEGPDELIAAITTLRSRLPPVQTLTGLIQKVTHRNDYRHSGTGYGEPGDVTNNDPDETTQGHPTPTRFQTAEGEPIHEVRIQGNQQFTEAQIRTALENGPEDIEEAIGNLRDTLPYFESGQPRN